MTKTKNHYGYYVAAQELTGIFRIRLLCGPFATFRQASMMIQPVKRAIDRAGSFRQCNLIVHKFTTTVDKPLPHGAVNLDAIDFNDVIEASVCR